MKKHILISISLIWFGYFTHAQTTIKTPRNISIDADSFGEYTAPQLA